eukprot:TRINITY_DN9694_c0_g1_i1.p1 TRINITY_DN9694_c0_g1~~TRINITY_DN9694_c0_g1_i1.p1  ORF type:complete len:111 (-),score=21.65 TRINITY_DN9694_c0_g1_i1:100-432(-)
MAKTLADTLCEHIEYRHCVLPLPDYEIEQLDRHELNSKLAELGLTPDEIKLVKQRRRALKSRVYTRKSRQKIDDTIKDLEIEKGVLMQEYRKIVKEITTLREMKQQYLHT